MIITRINKDDFLFEIDEKCFWLTDLGKPEMTINGTRFADIEQIEKIIRERGKELRALSVPIDEYRMTPYEAQVLTGF